MRCYDECWVDNDVSHLGYLFDLCDELFYELYQEHVKIPKFISAFMKSGCRKAMEEGNGELLSCGVADVMEAFINVDLNGNYQQFISSKDESDYYAYKELYWVGNFYAYLHWYLRVSSKTIMRVIPFKAAVDLYQCGHQMSFEGAIERIMWKFRRAGVRISEKKLNDDEFLDLCHMDKYGNKISEG